MGNFAPIATEIISLAQTVGSVVTVLDQTTDLINNRNDQRADQSLEQLQERQRLEEEQALKAANLQRQEISLKTQEAEQKRRSALKRAVARKRASFGGAGISSNNGSSEAVLLGMFDESDEERQNRERLDNIRLQSIDNDLANVKRVNTLQRTQLASRQRLNRNLQTRDDVQGLITSLF